MDFDLFSKNNSIYEFDQTNIILRFILYVSIAALKTELKNLG